MPWILNINRIQLLQQQQCGHFFTTVLRLVSCMYHNVIHSSNSGFTECVFVLVFTDKEHFKKIRALQ